ncbi:MAG: hypothetical protein NTW86_22485 [Candidatus Sumerlaeota bacterium]|nr:hypothetical protein [Candidatus Sumerlaeota bacterium]
MANENVFNDLDQLDNEIEKARVAKMATGLDYRAAHSAVARENPALMRLREGLYRQREASTIGLTVSRLVEGKLVMVDDEIENLTREAQAAHPELDYKSALRLVASENREMFRLREHIYQVLAR